MTALRDFANHIKGQPTKHLKRLSPAEEAECRKYLDYHKFAAQLIPGKDGINRADYTPALDGKPTDIDGVIALLRQFTILEADDELHDLVVMRFAPLVAGEVANAKAALTKQGNILGPADLTAKAGSTLVVLTWSAAPEALSYNIYRAKTSGGQGTNPDVKGVTTKTYIDRGLPNGKTYYYHVTATTAAGESMSSGEASAKPTDDSFADDTEQKQIQYSLKLRAKDEKAAVQVLPAVDITVQLGSDGKLQALEETQLNIIKVHIENNLRLVGKVEIEAGLTLNTKVSVTPDEIKLAEKKVKAEVEVKLGRISLKASAEADPTSGKKGPDAGMVSVTLHF
jgi:hypothetical protein